MSCCQFSYMGMSLRLKYILFSDEQYNCSVKNIVTLDPVPKVLDCECRRRVRILLNLVQQPRLHKIANFGHLQFTECDIALRLATHSRILADCMGNPIKYHCTPATFQFFDQQWLQHRIYCQVAHCHRLSKWDGSLLEEMTTVKNLSSSNPSSRETAVKWQ